MKFVHSFLNFKEKYTQKIVKHFPDFITPNLLTWLRILLLPVIIILIVRDKFISALIIFIIAYTLDFLDGPLARVKNKVSTYGALLDPFADKLVFLPVLFLIGWQALPPALLFAILILELGLVFLSTVLKSIAKKLKYKLKIEANIYGKCKMFFQVGGVFVLLLNPASETNATIATIIFFIAIILAIASIIEHVKSVEK